MKEAWKKSWKYLLILPIVIVAVVVLIVTLPKEENNPLMVTAKDIVLAVGGSKEIDYDVNIKQAIVSFDVSDETKANVDESEKKIVGLSEGKTALTVTAKYGNETSVVTVDVTVLDKNSPIIPEDPDTPDEKEEEIEESDDIKVLFDNVEVDELVLNIGENYNFTLNSDEPFYTFSHNYDEVKIAKITTNTYNIVVSESGHYSIIIQTPSYKKTLVIIVK